MIRGRGGIFDVEVDGVLLFSKFEAERFPETDEILVPLREQAAGERL